MLLLSSQLLRKASELILDIADKQGRFKLLHFFHLSQHDDNNNNNNNISNNRNNNNNLKKKQNKQTLIYCSPFFQPYVEKLLISPLKGTTAAKLTAIKSL